MRLFEGAFEAGDDEAAREWCGQIGERYPESWSGPFCALTMLAWGESVGGTATQAWELLGNAGIDAQHGMRPVFELQIARILAREGNADSARALLRGARARQPDNTELLQFEAAVFLALDQPDSASSRLRAFIDVSPATRQGVLSSRRFVELRE